MTKKVLLLATYDGPYSYLAIQSLIKHNVPVFGVAMDKKGVGERSLEIWNERTEGKLPIGNVSDFKSNNIRFFDFESHGSGDFKEFVINNDIDLLVNTGTPRIIKQDVLDTPRIGILNVHPSILPEYRGCTTMEWSIYNDDPVGNTAHFMTSSIDEGPIIEQESYVFKKSDTYSDVRSSLYKYNVDFMARVVNKVINNDITPQSLMPQRKGSYWNVIDDDKISIVKKKLNNGQYKYQK